MRTVDSVMSEDPFVVRPSQTFEHCADTMRLFDIRHLPVVTAGHRLAGLVADTDVFSHGRFDPEGIWIPARPELEGADIAAVIHPVEALEPSCPLPTAIHRLIEVDEDVLVVVGPREIPVGIFTEHDALTLAARELPANLAVAAHMAHTLITGGLETTLEEAWELLQTHGIRHLLVREGSRLLGVISHRDLLWSGASVTAGGTLADLCDPERQLITTTPDASLKAVAAQMADRKIGCMPVLAADQALMGLITATDAIKAYAERLASPPEELTEHPGPEPSTLDASDAPQGDGALQLS